MKTLRFLPLSIIGTGLLVTGLSANIIYLENFNSLENLTRPATQVGWQGSKSNGFLPSPDALGEAGTGGVNTGDGRQSNLGNPAGINSNPITAAYGIGLWTPTLIYNVAIATQEFGGFQSGQIQSFSWDLRVDGTSGFDVMRALVQVGGSASDTNNWYVSDPLITVDVAARQALWHTDTVLASGNWINMPSYNFATGAFAWPQSGTGKTEADFAGFAGYTYYNGSLPGGTVHGFGILIDNRGGGNLRLDNYTITAIPEPATVALLGGLFAMGMVLFQRRKGA